MKLRKGQRVHYKPYPECPENLMENGRVKRIHPDKDKAWVVYNCNHEWHNYMDYTGALTNYRELNKGWVKNPRNKQFKTKKDANH